MSTIITSVDRHSPAERAGITPGEQLLTINGHQIIDVLDYRFYGYDTDCCLGACGYRAHRVPAQARGPGPGPEF